MNVTLLIFVALSLMIFACTSENSPQDVIPPQACAADAKICPDGSAVGRAGPNCEFPKCPDAVVCPDDARECPDGSAVGRVPPDCEFEDCPDTVVGDPECLKNDPARSYTSRDPEECQRQQVLCAEGFERFDDLCGCGCKQVSDEKNFCTPAQKEAEICTLQYQPVCGYNENDEELETFGNSCQACAEPDVTYWIDGECI